ncbi:MAG TPA: hypothetical protein VFO76_06240 [Candidatus Kapabacteria bacterium]|nr:hypothetical protein [Candidatus Kapabacteria bacterium]
MKNEAPYMTEEHIVAWLDGELQADGEVRTALKQDTALQSAAKDYNALSQAFARSKSDSRFVLPATVDSRVVAALRSEISRNHKAVPVPGRVADAEPIAKPSTANRIKKVWIRRSSYAALLLLLIGGAWFGFQSKQDTPVTAFAPNTEAPAPQPSVSTQVQPPGADISTPAPSATTDVATGHIASHTTTHATQLNTVSQEVKQVVNEPASAATQTATAETPDPAAIMISHRYAKLIKATPTVVVSQSDKMDKM